MANISLKECSDTEDGQKWNVMADGRIALELSKPRKCCKKPRTGDEPGADTPIQRNALTCST